MMKKILAIALAVLISLGMISCGKSDTGNTVKPDATATAEAATETPAPATSTPEPKDVNSFDYTEKTINADVLFPYCKTQGRTIVTDYTFKKSATPVPGIALDYSASAIEFNAYCEGTVSAMIKVKSTGIGGAKLYVSVYVDGEQVGTRATFKLTKSAGVEIVLGENLERGLHNFRIERQSEAERGLIYIDYVKLSGELGEKPANAKYFVEIIGDSITTGYGNLYPNDSDGEKGANAAANEYVDGTRTYAVLAAKAIGADYSVVAQQGIGIVKGWYEHTMLQKYTETCYQCDRHDEWNFERKADVVVINLGTNDAGFYGRGEVSLDKIKKGIRDFIDLVKSKYPDAKILWAYGMMDQFLCPYIEEAINEKGGAAAGYYFLKLTANGEGGNGHPSLNAHINNGKKLEKKLKEILNIK